MFKVKEGLKLFNNQTTVRYPTGNYGSFEIDGGAKGSWEGFSIGGRAVFMHDNGTATGIYNDVDNEWMFLGYRNAQVQLYYDGSNKFQTTSSGAQVNGLLDIRGNLEFDGTATTTNQSRGIVWTGFDKEGTTDFSDNAHIKHITNSGGLSGSVLEIKSMNDSNDGVNFNVNSNTGVRIKGNPIFHDAYHPNADKWTTARTITLGGDLTGSVSLDGSSNVTLSAQVVNDSHTHDGRYYTESEIQTFMNRGYISNHGASNLAVGWYTIATNTGDRASARFGIWDANSGDHQAVTFYASHHFGTDSSNTITVLDNSYYSGNPFRYIRIKDAGTYDGAALQIYIDDASNSVLCAILGDNFQPSGWVLCDWIPDATTPPNVSNYANFGERSKVDLNQIAQGGFATTGEIYAGGDTTLQRVFHDNYHPNADKWTTARTLSLTGDVTGSVSWDGSANASITTTVANDSHNHDHSDGNFTVNGDLTISGNGEELNFTGGNNRIKFSGYRAMEGTTDGGNLHLAEQYAHVNCMANMNLSSGHEYRINGTTVIDSARNAIGFVDIKGSGSYHEFGDAIGSVSNDASWNARLNLAGSQHARLDVKSVSDGIITSMYAHTGQNQGRIGTISNHSLGLMTNGSVYASLSTGGVFNVFNGYQVNGTTVIDSSRNLTNINNATVNRVTATSSGMSLFATNLTSNDDWANSPISIRERGLVGSAQSADSYAPNLNFHWGSRASKSLWMNASGHLVYGDYSGTGVPSSVGTFATSDIRADVFYDLSDISTYMEMRGDSGGVRVKTSNGYIDIGAMNSGWGHISTDRPSFYFNKKLTVDEGIIQSYNEDLILRRAESSSHQMTLNTSGATFTGNVTAYSDITLKDNITNIDNALEKVNLIRGVTYDRIDQDNARHAGVIAQEVEGVLPEVVHTDDNGIKSVAYGNMVGLLIEAIKEQQTQIEKQQTQIEELQAQINTLKGEK